jgi:hypothetical protein
LAGGAELSGAQKTLRALIACVFGIAMLACAAGIAWRRATAVPERAAWVVDDGGRAWAPGEAVALFGLPGETVALQVVVRAGTEALDGVTVEASDLGADVAVERFVVGELAMARRSGGRDAGESLGWQEGAMPPWSGRAESVPDPLIPVEHAPAWADYPMHVARGRERAVWLDVTPTAQAVAGTRHLQIKVAYASNEATLIPVTFEVGRVALPYRALGTMVFVERERLERRGGRKAVDAALQMLHRHHLSAITTLATADDVRAERAALTGELYTPAHGYHGPGEGVATDVVVVGAYGALGDPTPAALDKARAIVDELGALGIEDQPGTRDVFLYAIDEKCASPRAGAWRRALRASGSARLAKLRVGQTCEEPPSAQDADVAMMPAGEFRPGLGAWIYNGMLPHTGAFLSDAWPLSLRANGWIQAWYGIPRWFYWEASFWDDDNPGGQGPYDALERAETFHNKDGDHANGDGVLLYPGRQRAPFRDLGIDGVVPSIRLKQWRRGIQDAAYLQLARRVDPTAADDIARALVGKAFDAKKKPAWPTEPGPWLEARRKLFDIIARGP